MSEDTERHAMKMAKKKAARDKIMATKTDKKGLVIIHTGKGKGKAHRRLASLETLSTPSDIVAEVRDYVTSINSW